MTIKKVLGTVGIVAVAIIGYVLTNSNGHREMHYTGRIDDNNVRFSERPWSPYSTLQVEKPGGQTVEYIFRELPPNRLKLIEIVVKNGGLETKLDGAAPNAAKDTTIKQAMDKLPDYINAIAKANNAQGSVAIKQTQ